MMDCYVAQVEQCYKLCFLEFQILFNFLEDFILHE